MTSAQSSCCTSVPQHQTPEFGSLATGAPYPPTFPWARKFSGWLVKGQRTWKALVEMKKLWFSRPSIPRKLLGKHWKEQDRLFFCCCCFYRSQWTPEYSHHISVCKSMFSSEKCLHLGNSWLEFYKKDILSVNCSTQLLIKNILRYPKNEEKQLSAAVMHYYHYYVFEKVYAKIHDFSPFCTEVIFC